MEYENYNPSPLEVEFADAIEQLSDQLAALIPDKKIINIEKRVNQDNPQLNITLESEQGKKSEIVIKIIQRVDQELGDI